MATSGIAAILVLTSTETSKDVYCSQRLTDRSDWRFQFPKSPLHVEKPGPHLTQLYLRQQLWFEFQVSAFRKFCFNTCMKTCYYLTAISIMH